MNCPICNKAMEKAHFEWVCIPAKFNYTSIQSIENWLNEYGLENVFYHMYQVNIDLLQKSNIIFAIKTDKIHSYELYSAGVIYDNFHTPHNFEYDGDNTRFLNCKTFEEVKSIVNKIRVFS